VEGATVGLGLTRSATKEELRSAALDGSIEQLVHWRKVSAGDFLFVPARTVHALGAGICLLEFQQNDGVTYRLYDYGRPRELHLDDGIAVCLGEPYPPHLASRVAPDRTSILVDCPQFRLAHALAADAPDMFADERRWVMPIEGQGRSGVHSSVPGECLLLQPGELLEVETGRYLIGAEPSAEVSQNSMAELSMVA
jgi:mannose-6-phosphate isomerase